MINTDFRLAIELAKIRPAWQGLMRMSRGVDTLILGDSVARVNISSAQWHCMGLGNVMNLGNTGVSGLKTDYAMLGEYARRFGKPTRLIIVRHIGSYLDDLPLNWRQTALQPLAACILKYRGVYPNVPVINDVRAPGMKANRETVEEYLALRPKWLVGPFSWSALNAYYARRLINEFPWVVFVPGPVCNRVARESRQLRDDFGDAITRLGGKFLPELHYFQVDEMQDPNHLAPAAALQWSEAVAEQVRRV